MSCLSARCGGMAAKMLMEMVVIAAMTSSILEVVCAGLVRARVPRRQD